MAFPARSTGSFSLLKKPVCRKPPRTDLVSALSSIYGSERQSIGECLREEKKKNPASQDAEGETISRHKFPIPSAPALSPCVRGTEQLAAPLMAGSKELGNLCTTLSKMLRSPTRLNCFLYLNCLLAGRMRGTAAKWRLPSSKQRRKS